MIWPNDPEGILSTLMAVLTTYIGVETGLVLFNEKGKRDLQEMRRHVRVEIQWVILGSIVSVVGVLLSIWLPFNKKIWSLSFGLFTGGLGTLFLAFCYLIVDVMRWKSSKFIQIPIKPLIWLGTNPLAVFIGMVFVEIVLLRWITSPWVLIWHEQQTVSAWIWIYWNLFQVWIHDEKLASLLVATVHLLLWITVAGIMHRKKIFLKL